MADTINKYKYRAPRRPMPGTPLPTHADREIDERSFQLNRRNEFTDHLRFFLDDTPDPRSGSRGLRLDKISATDTSPHSLQFRVAGNPRWELGMDFDTNVTGDSDFVLVFDHSANGGKGADCVRCTSESMSSVGTGMKMNWGFQVGSAAANTHFLTLRPGSGVGGIRIHHNAVTTYDTMIVDTLNAGDSRCSYGFGNRNGDTWGLIQDISATDAHDLTLSDRLNAKSRLTIISSNSNRAAFGFGGGNPQAVVSAVTSPANADFETPQRAFMMSFNDTPSNHSLNISQILNASAVTNYIWMKGSLGSTATVATPTCTAAQQGFGFECKDTQMSVITAPTGTNQTISRPLTFGSNTMGFFGATPVTRAAAYTLAGSVTRSFPADPSSAYTGINNAQAGTPYAQLTDLNTLRTAVSTLIGVVRQVATDLGSTSGLGLLNA